MSNNIYNYVKKANYQSDSPLSNLRDYAILHDVPIVSDEVLNLLNVLMLLKKPARILELGTAIGYTAINFAINSEADITSVELDDEMVNLALFNIGATGYSDRIEVIRGDAALVLDDLMKIGDTFDFIFIDAAKGQYLTYYKKCEDILSDEGVIVCDNVLYKGLASGVRTVRRNKTIAHRMRELVDYVMSLEQYESTLLQSGDGVLISVKK